MGISEFFSVLAQHSAIINVRTHSDSPFCSKLVQKQFVGAYSTQPLRRLYSVSAQVGEPDLDLKDNAAVISEDDIVVSYCMDEPVYELQLA